MWDVYLDGCCFLSGIIKMHVTMLCSSKEIEEENPAKWYIDSFKMNCLEHARSGVRVKRL